MHLGGTAKDFVYLVLMTWWLLSSPSTPLPWDDMATFDFIEYYSGVGRIGKMAHGVGYSAATFDIGQDIPGEGESAHSQMPHRSAFDMNGEAGYVFPISKK